MEELFFTLLAWIFKTQNLASIAPWKLIIFIGGLVSLYFIIKTYLRTRKIVNGDLCNKAQARIAFKNLTQIHRHEIENFFFRTNEKNKLSKQNDETLFNLFDDFFKGIQDKAIDELNHFSVNNHYLGSFLINCSVEYATIKNHLLNTLNGSETEKQEIPFYLKNKFESINGSFGIWIRLKQKEVKKDED